MRLIKRLFPLVFILNFTMAFSQDTLNVKVSDNKVVIAGKKYYMHEVQKGETIYAISKAYNVMQKDIAIENPEVFDGLKIGQTLKIPMVDEVRSLDAGKYIYHTVQKGETIYFLTRKYNVKEKEIYKLNAKVKDGLKIGMVIKIKKPKNKEIILPNEDENYFYHRVEKKQTLYSLTRKYEISQERLFEVNPELKEIGLKYDQIVRIPKKKVELVEQKDTIPCLDSLAQDSISRIDTNVYNCVYNYHENPKRFKIGLMLPFHRDAKIINIEAEEKEIDKIKSKPFFEFYEGFLLAIDEMQDNGIMLDLFVYDTKKDSATVIDITRNEEFDTLDLIIGPVYPELVSVVSEKSKELKIPQVAPFAAGKDIIVDNPFVFQVVPPFETQLVEALSFMAMSERPRFIIIHNSTKEDSALIKVYKEILVEKIVENGRSKKITIHELSFKKHGLKGIEEALLKDTTNLIIVPSSDQAFVSDVITKIYTKFHKNYDITLAGFPSWLRYDNLPLEYYHEFQLHTFLNYFVDYEDFSVQKFVSAYRNIYEGEPTKYSFCGYDIGKYFLSALIEYGPEFYNCIDSLEVPLLQSIYKFSQENDSSGYQNTGTYIIKYNQEYEVYPVYPYLPENSPDMKGVREEDAELPK